MARPPMNFRAKWVGRYSPPERMLRLGRVMWESGTPGDGHGYSVKLSAAVWPVAFRMKRARGEFDATLLGVRVHMKRAYGGKYV